MLAALCGCVLTNAASAADSFSEPAMKAVSYAGLNLDSQAGSQTLYRRLRKAANRVCESTRGRGIRMIEWRECIDQALARAVSQVDRPAVTAYHVAQNGKVESPLKLANEQ
jgi:UrcA family protein